MKKLFLLGFIVFTQIKSAEKESSEAPMRKSPVIRPCPSLSPAAMAEAQRISQLGLEEAKKSAAVKAQETMCDTHPRYASSDKLRTLVYKMLLFCDHKKPHRVYLCNYTNKEHGSGCYKTTHDNKLWGCINYNEKSAKDQKYGYKKLTLFREVWKLTQLHNQDKELSALCEDEIETLELNADKNALRATSCLKCHTEFMQGFIQKTENLSDFKAVFDEIASGTVDEEEYQKIVENYLKIAATQAPGMPTILSLKRAFALSKASTHFGKPCEYHASPLHQPGIILDGNRIKKSVTNATVLQQIHSL